MNAYEQKISAKRERLLERAARLRKEAEAQYTRAKTAASCIPFGQPILVGHHSEGRDRRFRERIHQTYGRSFALQDAASDAERRALSVGEGGISSDDPDAVVKLREKLVKLEAHQEHMRKANVCVRKNDVAGLIALGMGKEAADALLQPDFAGRLGYASYQLSNNNANIRRIKERIQALEANASRVDREDESGGIILREDVAANRVMLVFPGKPSADARTLLKRWGFKWSPTNAAWQRHLNSAGRYAAKEAREELLRLANAA